MSSINTISAEKLARLIGTPKCPTLVGVLHPWALALSVAAAITIFRFKIGMISTLAACSTVGAGLYLLGAIS